MVNHAFLMGFFILIDARSPAALKHDTEVCTPFIISHEFFHLSNIFNKSERAFFELRKCAFPMLGNIIKNNGH